MEPSVFIYYMIELARSVSTSQNGLFVKGKRGGGGVRMERGVLMDVARCVVAEGLRVLGLEPMEMM
jgi:arginyl-tRNA synthetase